MWDDSYIKCPPLIERPIPFFSTKEEFFFSLQRISLMEPLGYYWEDSMVRIYVSSGQGMIWINGIGFPLKTGTVCFLNSYHVFKIEPDECLELCIMVTDNAFNNYLNITPPTEYEFDVFDYCPIIHLSKLQQREYEDILARFELEARIDDTSSPIIKSSLIMQLGVIENEGMENTVAWEPPIGWKILSYITRYNSNKITVDMVAHQFSLSKSALNHTLRKITTYSCNQLLSRARINAVCALLPFRGFSLQYISNYFNFPSEKSFYDAFRTWKGMTPREYREIVPTHIFGHDSRGIVELPLMIMAYICQNYLSPISVKTAAKELYVSEKQINHALSAYTGASFKTHLTQHRLNYAKALLRTTSLPICDVAVGSGFDSISTFCRIFKLSVGMTASDYRFLYGGSVHGAK